MNARFLRRVPMALTTVLLFSACSTLVLPPKNTSEGLLIGTIWQLQKLGAVGAIIGNSRRFRSRKAAGRAAPVVQISSMGR
jgi:hypothetical protein